MKVSVYSLPPARDRETFALSTKGIPRSQMSWDVNYIRDPGKTDDWCDFWAQAVAASPVATAIVRRLGDFIGGKGFTTSSLNGKKVNEEDTLLDLHNQLVQDYALWGRFAVRLIPNRSFSQYTLHHIPAEWVRYEWKDDNGYVEDIDACWVLPMINSSEPKQMQSELLPIWDGKRDFKQDIDYAKDDKGRMVWKWKWEKADEWKPYRGHIFFFNPPSQVNRVYSRTHLFAAEKDVLADGRVGEFFERLTVNQFLPGGIMTVFGDPQERVREWGDGQYETAEEILNTQLSEHFSGTASAGSVVVFWARNNESVPSLQPFQVGNLHEMFLNANEVIRGRIAMAGQMPEALLGVQQSGRLGQNQTLIHAIGFANESTEKQRRKLEDAYKLLLNGVKGVNAGKISIQPIQNFGDLPDLIFSAMTVKQKEAYMSEVFGIEPDPEGHTLPNIQPGAETEEEAEESEQQTQTDADD